MSENEGEVRIHIGKYHRRTPPQDLLKPGLGVPSSLAPWSDDNSNPIGDFLTEVSACQTSVSELEKTLQQNSETASDSINTAMAAAFGKLFQLAVFIRGNYDERLSNGSVDEAAKKEILDSVLSTFLAVQNIAESSSRDLSSIHAQVLEVRNARVLVLKDRVHNASGLISVRLAGSGSAIQDANRNMAKLEQSVREANRNMDELRDRKASQERAATATDIGVHVFFNMHALQANVLLARYSHPWGLENRECYDSDKSPSAVLGLQDNIRDLQQNISQMNTRLSEASQNINDLKIEEQILERRHVSQKAALEQIPSIERSTEGILARIDTLTRSLVVLKNVAAQMCSRAGQLNNDAIRAAHLSFLKEEFANAILDICLLGVIDQTRMSEVKKITTELTSEYSSNGIPQNLQEKVDAIARKIKSITISSPPC